jgi:hypothetical protein
MLASVFAFIIITEAISVNLITGMGWARAAISGFVNDVC